MGFIFAALFAGYSPKPTPMMKQNSTAMSTTAPFILNVRSRLATTTLIIRSVPHDRKMPIAQPSMHSRMKPVRMSAMVEGTCMRVLSVWEPFVSTASIEAMMIIANGLS